MSMIYTPCPYIVPCQVTKTWARLDLNRQTKISLQNAVDHLQTEVNVPGLRKKLRF